MPAALAAAAALLLAAGDAPRVFAVAPGSAITFRLVHKLHTVEGVCREVEGRARVLPSGTVQVMVRAPLASFDSGNSNRDAHMREATGAATQPYVMFKGVGTLHEPASYPADVVVPLTGEVTLKTARPATVDVRLRFEAPDRATAEATFPVSLDEHGVERPALMFVKVDDRVVIDARLRLEASP